MYYLFACLASSWEIERKLRLARRSAARSGSPAARRRDRRRRAKGECERDRCSPLQRDVSMLTLKNEVTFCMLYYAAYRQK